MEKFPKNSIIPDSHSSWLILVFRLKSDEEAAEKNVIQGFRIVFVDSELNRLREPARMQLPTQSFYLDSIKEQKLFNWLDLTGKTSFFHISRVFKSQANTC